MTVFSSPVSLPELKVYDVYHGKMAKEISENRAADGTNPDTFIACETLYRHSFAAIREETIQRNLKRTNVN